MLLMIKTFFTTVVLAACLALAGAGAVVSAPALAQSQSEQDEIRRALENGQIIPYGEIARRAERLFDGRVVGQKVRRMGPGRFVYELRLLHENGQVTHVLMDAHNGRVLGSERGQQ